MGNEKDQYTFDRVVRMVLSAVTLVALFFLLRYLSDVLLPFAAAVVLAYLLNPLVTLFEKKTKRRGLAVALTLGGLAIAGLALVVLIVPLMVSQVTRFGRDLDTLRGDLAASTSVATGESVPPVSPAAQSESGDEPVEKTALGWHELSEGWGQFRNDAGDRSRAERFAELRSGVSGTFIGNVLEDAIEFTQSDEFRNLMLNAAKQLAIGGWTVFSFALNLLLGLTGLIVVLLYLVFLLLDFPEYARIWPSFLPPNYRDTTVEFLGQFNTAMRKYFRGQFVVALLVGTLFTIGFTIMGLPMAVPFGAFVGLLNMVPYLQMVAIVPALMLAGLRAIELDASLAGSIFLVLLIFAVVQMIQDSIITPRVMGKATGLRPVAILLGVFIWGKLLGFLGLILAIPLTCLGIAYYRRYVLVHASTQPGASTG